MKGSVVKIFVAIILAALVGLICYYLAPDEENRRWISFGVTTGTLALSLILAMGIEYNCGNRNANIKTIAWIFTMFVLICNIVFSCFCYPVVIYISVSGLLAVIDFISVYSLYQSKHRFELNEG